MQVYVISPEDSYVLTDRHQEPLLSAAHALLMTYVVGQK